MVQNYDDNPLKLCRGDNCRMVIDKTFAVRFRNFVDHCVKSYGAGDFIIDEEGEYMKYMADKILDYQIKTSDTAEENIYFKNLNINI